MKSHQSKSKAKSKSYVLHEGQYGIGLCAREAINKASVIFREVPILFVADELQGDADIIGSFIQKHPLNAALRKAGCRVNELHAVCQFLLQCKEDKKSRVVLDKMATGPEYKASDCDEKYLGAIASITEFSESEVLSAIGKVRTNLFSVTGSLIQLSVGSAIYEDAGFINHSCNPNSTAYFELDGSVVWLATRDIAPGEEITWSYARNLPPLVTERRKRLLERYHFICTCPRCVEEEDTDKSVDPVTEVRSTPVDQLHASDGDIGKLLDTTGLMINSILSKRTDARMVIRKDLVFGDDSNAAFFELSGYVRFPHPLAYPKTRLLVYVISASNSILRDNSLYDCISEVLHFAYSTLLCESELRELPIAISAYLFSSSLSYAASWPEFPRGIRSLIVRLVESDALEFGNVMCVLGLAAQFLGDQMSPLVSHLTTASTGESAVSSRFL